MAPKRTKRKLPDRWRNIVLERPAALDLFCGGGGAGEGLRRAGYKTVVGIDSSMEHKKSYEHAAGMHFVLGDVFDLLPQEDLQQFDLVWASPPCQCYCGLVTAAQRAKHMERWQAQGRHLDHIPKVREMLVASGRPYIIENVPNAPLERYVKLCGTHFGLSTFRYFHAKIKP